MGSVAVGLEIDHHRDRALITEVHRYRGENMSLVGRDVIDLVYLTGPRQGEHVTTYWFD